ncbi:hypothetical protein FB451DRAFT_1465693 [Mycena latifolia]|nr:hypothetical protein FB451DRAFT_1465693 [Mycena latifolia]
MSTLTLTFAGRRRRAVHRGRPTRTARRATRPRRWGRAMRAGTAPQPRRGPRGGALANAANQGGLDALEEVRLLKDQVRDVSRVCNAVATGDLTQNIIVPVQGDLMVQLKKLRASFLPLASDWRALRAAAKRARRPLPLLPISLIAAVTTAVAKGDLSKQIKVSANGEILDLKNTVNGMVFRLRTLAVGVTRVSLEEPSLEIGRRRTASSEEASSHLRMPSTVDALRVFCFCGEKGVMRLMRFFNDALLRREKSERCAAPSLLSSHASRHLRDAIRARDCASCKLGGEASVSDVICTTAQCSRGRYMPRTQGRPRMREWAEEAWQLRARPESVRAGARRHPPAYASLYPLSGVCAESVVASDAVVGVKSADISKVAP